MTTLRFSSIYLLLGSLLFTSFADKSSSGILETSSDAISTTAAPPVKKRDNGDTTILFDAETEVKNVEPAPAPVAPAKKPPAKVAPTPKPAPAPKPEVAKPTVAPAPVVEVDVKEVEEKEVPVAPAAEVNAAVVPDSNGSAPPSSFLASDFFAGALEAARAGDAMGTQRLVDVKSGRLTPSIAFNMGYNYTSNPIKVAKESAGYSPDGFTALLNLTFNMGLGEYGIGEDVLLAPSLMLMHMRTYTDPAKDHGNEMEGFDVDVQIAGLTLPVILPNDYTVVLGHTYVRPISFRAENVISYSNTPNISLTKILPLPTGDVLSLTAGTSYAFSTGDTLQQQIDDEVYFNFIKAAMGGDAAVLAQQPINAQNAWTHTLNLSYIKPIGEQLTLTPSITVNRAEYMEGANEGRDDTSYLATVVAAYTISEWVNVSAATNYMWKRSSFPDLDFEDFIGGVTMGFNYAF
jgi:hypothetical protein